MLTSTEAVLRDKSVSWQDMFNKVPEVTLYFWIIKILCTTVGETFADFLNVNLNIGLTATSIVMGIMLAIALFFQFRSRKYTPGIYWVAVAFISVFGTLVTDNLTDALHVPLELSTIVFSIILGITFSVWHASEKTLSIHSITTRRREIFYWLTILFTFALGTAAGDLMAESLGLGYLVTGAIVAGIIACSAVARRLGLNAVLSFWIIYIMTRPLGASLGDYLSQPHKYGGLGLGATGTSVIFISGIIALVLFLTFTKRDVITQAPSEEEHTTSPRQALMQTIVTIILLSTIAISAYFSRHRVLENQINSSLSSSSTKASPQEDNTAQNSPLGDLSPFKKITEDTRALVIAGDFAGAKSRVSDLEYEWDNAESRLKPMNGAKWTKVDDGIDKVLRQIRAVNPDPETSKSALDALIVTLQ